MGKKIQKIKKAPLRLHLKPKRVGTGREREKKKNYHSDRSYPIQNKKFQKEGQKYSKIKEHHLGFI